MKPYLTCGFRDCPHERLRARYSHLIAWLKRSNYDLSISDCAVTVGLRYIVDIKINLDVLDLQPTTML
jgi:hypothetical protein